jgi:imidazolonepropionase-like amidohydrolase
MCWRGLIAAGLVYGVWAHGPGRADLTTNRCSARVQVHDCPASPIAPPFETWQTTVLRDVTLIDGAGGPPRPHMTIVITGERITQIAPTSQAPLSDAATVLDVTGQYVIPGLIDSHVHVTNHTRAIEAHLARALQGGVTTVRDMGGDTAWVGELSERVTAEGVASPRIYFAVPVSGVYRLGRPRSLAARPNAFSVVPWLMTVADQTPVRTSARWIKTAGARGVKIYSDLSNQRTRELADAARAEGLKVWGHARIFPGRPSEAVTAGVEVLSHSSMLACEASDEAADPCDHGARLESSAFTRLFALMRERGAILDATLAVLHFLTVANGGDPKQRASAPQFVFGAEATRRAHALGIRIAAGTDLFLLRGASRPSIHDEMELLVTYAGLTPLEAITAATRTGAEILGLERELGVIEVGKLADLVVLTADPAHDIRNTRRISVVLQGGRVFPAETSHGWKLTAR